MKHLAILLTHSVILQHKLRIFGHNAAKLALNFIPELALPEMLGCLLPDLFSACKAYGLKSSHASPSATAHTPPHTLESLAGDAERLL